MSHYPVAVFSRDLDQDIDALLAPYDENISVPPYVSLTKEQLIQRERDTMQSCFESRYADWQKDKEGYEERCRNPAHIDYLNRLPELMKRSDDELYAEAIRGYEPEEMTTEGSILSRYNPV